MPKAFAKHRGTSLIRGLPQVQNLAGLQITDFFILDEDIPKGALSLAESHDLFVFAVRDSRTGRLVGATCIPTPENCLRIAELTEDPGWLKAQSPPRSTLVAAGRRS